VKVIEIVWKWSWMPGWETEIPKRRLNLKPTQKDRRWTKPLKEERGKETTYRKTIAADDIFAAAPNSATTPGGQD